MLRVIRDNPTEDIRLLFQRDQNIRKGSQTKYSTWCVKNSIKYGFGEEIPQTWINEKVKSNTLRSFGNATLEQR